MDLNQTTTPGAKYEPWRMPAGHAVTGEQKSSVTCLFCNRAWTDRSVYVSGVMQRVGICAECARKAVAALEVEA